VSDVAVIIIIIIYRLSCIHVDLGHATLHSLAALAVVAAVKYALRERVCCVRLPVRLDWQESVTIIPGSC
jgi:branched-subunit amino acid transport protein AzlD